MDAFFAHNWLFDFGGYWGVVFAFGITVLYLCISDRMQNIEEQILTLMLLWLPVVAVAAATVSQGGMSQRYMLPAILGGALALGYVIDKVPKAGRLLLLALFLMNYTLSSLSVVSQFLNGSLLDARAYAASEGNAMTGKNDAALPIVISDELRYLPMAYYQLAEPNSKLYAIADPRAAATFSDKKSDSLDLALLVLRRYFPLQVEDYDGFVSKHQKFLLVLGGGPFDWWPARLAQDGHMLRLLSASGGTKVYKVIVKPK